MISNEEKNYADIPSITISDWGLFPLFTANMSWQAILRWWFIRYNPLYFFSAFFILIGVVLVTGASGGNQNTEIALFAVIQTYEFMLIGGATILVHKLGQIRPAILLILLELVFLFDCTFRLETIVAFEETGRLVSALWVLGSGLKFWGILKVLKVSHDLFLPIITSVAAAGIVMMLQLLTVFEIHHLSILQATGWLGALLLIMVWRRSPVLISPLIISERDEIFARRIASSIFALLAGFYFYHLASYSIWMFFDPIMALLTHSSTVLFVVALFRKEADKVFKFALGAYVLSLANPTTFFIFSVMLALLFSYFALWRKMSALAIAATFCGYLALCSMGKPFADMLIWQGVLSLPTLTLIGLLILIGWKLKVTLVWVILALGAILAAIMADWSWLYRIWIGLKGFLPNSRLAIGITFLALGFVALLSGLGINWWLHRKSGKEGTDA